MTEAIIALALIALVLALAMPWVHIFHSPEYRHMLRLEKAKRTWAKILMEGDRYETKS